MNRAISKKIRLNNAMSYPVFSKFYLNMKVASSMFVFSGVHMAYPMHNVKLMYSYIQLMSLDACFDNITLNLLKAMAAPKVFKKHLLEQCFHALYHSDLFQ